MRFSVLMCLAAVVTAVTAFHIPDGQLDGVYEVSYNEDGTENHVRIGNISTKSTTLAIRGATIQERGGTVTCHDDEGILNGNDNGAAATSLANQCGAGAGVIGGYDYYSIVGCSVAYFCNFKKVTQVCTSGNAWTSFDNINYVCGYNIPGYETYSDPNGKDSYGYEWFCTYPGSNFCGRGVNGKRSTE